MRRAPGLANPSALPGLIAQLHHQGRVALRLQINFLALAGYPVETIADVVVYHPRTVQRWLTRYEAEGVPRLPDRPRSGRPRLVRPGSASGWWPVWAS